MREEVLYGLTMRAQIQSFLDGDFGAVSGHERLIMAQNHSSELRECRLRRQCRLKCHEWRTDSTGALVASKYVNGKDIQLSTAEWSPNYRLNCRALMQRALATKENGSECSNMVAGRNKTNNKGNVVCARAR